MKKIMGGAIAASLLCAQLFGQEAAYKTWSNGTTEYVPLGSQLSIDTSAIPEGAGQVVFSFNSGEFTEYTGPIVFNEEGQIVLIYATKNAWGEVQNMEMFSAFVDGTAPTLKYMLSGPFYVDASGNAYVTGETAIHLYGEDALSGTEHVYVSLNEGETVDVVNSSVMYFNGMEDGPVSVSSRAVDYVGNESETIGLSVTVDSQGPQTAYACSIEPLVIDGVTYVNPSSEITISAEDGASGIKDIFISVNDSDFTRYQDTIIPLAGVDNYLIRAYAVDNLGNVGETVEFSFSTNLALTAPAVNWEVNGVVLTPADRGATDTLPAEVNEPAAADPAITEDPAVTADPAAVSEPIVETSPEAAL